MEPIKLDTGQVTLEQLIAIFKTIPQEFDLLDENDIVRWYSNNHSLFSRDLSDLNKHVLDVHPKHSADRVKKVLAQMHDNTRDSIEMTIPAKGKQIHISFYALRDKFDRYLGCVEVTEDVTEFVKSSKLSNFLKLLKMKK